MLLVTLFSLLFSSPAPAREQFSADQPRYSVRGTVVNSGTGEPIRGALVQFYSDRQRSQLTGADGTFQFDQIPAGMFPIQLRKPGYFSTQELPSGRMQTLMLTSGPDQPPAVLKLVPEGVIFGRVTGDAGEPLEYLPVQLLSERVENGHKTRTVWRGNSTNEEGQFRLAELQPGTYFLFVGPSPQPASFSGSAARPNAQGYPAVFYPGGSDISSAAPIQITPGKHLELNISLARQPFYRISGTVSGYAQESGVNLQFFNAAGQSIDSGLEFDPRTGVFRSKWVPAGQIIISAFSSDPKAQQTYSASQTVNVVSDRAGIHLALVPNVTIPVNMRLERTRNDSPRQFFSGVKTSFGSPPEDAPPARVVLIPTDPAGFRTQYGSEFLGPEENRSLGIRNVLPGTYRVEIDPNGPYYVESARLGLSDLLAGTLTIAPGSSVESLEILLRDDGASLEGSVSLNRQRVAGSILVIPVSRPGPVVLTFCGPDGRFRVENLAPGSYRVLALDHGDNFEYANPEALRKYSSGAQEVSLGPNQSSKVELQLLRTEEQNP